MSVDNFIPQIWATSVLINLFKSLVYAQPAVINRDYQGDIQNAGDTVRINNIGAVTVSDYVKNTDMAAPQTLSDADTALLIDQQKSFFFQIDDVDRIQQTPKIMGAAMQQAAYNLRDAADQFVASHYTDIATANFIATNGAPKTDLGTAGKAYEYLVDLGSILTASNVPLEGRWVVVPPWYHGALLKDDRFVRSFLQDVSRAALVNGEVGQAAGFQVLVSNNVPSTSSTASYKIIAGYPGAWTFADQANQLEAIRLQYRFSDAVKGLHIYGARVTRPAGLALLFASSP